MRTKIERSRVRRRVPAIAAAVFLGAAGPAGPCAAGELRTERFDLPSLPLGYFGTGIAIDYGMLSDDIIGGAIVETRMHLELDTTVPPALDDAANLQVQFQPPVAGVPFWYVNASDLGWRGTGSFHGTVSTDELNLPLIDFPVGVTTLWFVSVVSAEGGGAPLGGQLANSYIEVDILVPEACVGDLDDDGEVGFRDLSLLLGSWGPCRCLADVDEDAGVGFADLTVLLAAWGTCG